MRMTPVCVPGNVIFFRAFSQIWPPLPSTHVCDSSPVFRDGSVLEIQAGLFKIHECVCWGFRLVTDG